MFVNTEYIACKHPVVNTADIDIRDLLLPVFAVKNIPTPDAVTAAVKE